jgi:hypothetical protein
MAASLPLPTGRSARCRLGVGSIGKLHCCRSLRRCMSYHSFRSCGHPSTDSRTSQRSSWCRQGTRKGLLYRPGCRRTSASRNHSWTCPCSSRHTCCCTWRAPMRRQPNTPRGCRPGSPGNDCDSCRSSERWSEGRHKTTLRLPGRQDHRPSIQSRRPGTGIRPLRKTLGWGNGCRRFRSAGCWFEDQRTKSRTGSARWRIRPSSCQPHTGNQADSGSGKSRSGWRWFADRSTLRCTG